MQRRPTPTEIAYWQQFWPEANWAVVTGAISNIDVMDIERRGLPFLQDRPLPIAPYVRTQSRGLHGWFRHVPGISSAAWNEGGVHLGDLQADGRYVVVPISVGLKGIYTWCPFLSLCEVPPGEAPAWVKLLGRVGQHGHVAGAAVGNTVGGGSPAAAPRSIQAHRAKSTVQPVPSHMAPSRVPEGHTVSPSNHTVSPTAAQAPLSSLSPRVRGFLEHGLRTGDGYRSRSEGFQSAVFAMTASGWSRDHMIAIFDDLPGGEKYREHGRRRLRYLDLSIEKAQAFQVQQQRAVMRVRIVRCFADEATSPGRPPGLRLRLILESLEGDAAGRQRFRDGVSMPDGARTTEERWRAFWIAVGVGNVPLTPDAARRIARRVEGRALFACVVIRNGSPHIERFISPENSIAGGST
jgi:hypothetical protein